MDHLKMLVDPHLLDQKKQGLSEKLVITEVLLKLEYFQPNLIPPAKKGFLPCRLACFVDLKARLVCLVANLLLMEQVRLVHAVEMKDSLAVECCLHQFLLPLQRWYQLRSEQRIQHDRYPQEHVEYLSYSVVPPIL